MARIVLLLGAAEDFMNKNETGKMRVIKASLLYLWEEIKTMNLTKLKALTRILTGYIKMKFLDHPQKSNTRKSDFSLDGR